MRGMRHAFFLYACVYNVSLDIVVSVGNLSEWIEYENRNINDQINDAMPGVDVWGIGTETTTGVQ